MQLADTPHYLNRLPDSHRKRRAHIATELYMHQENVHGEATDQ
jgi:hypothetical protein